MGGWKWATGVALLASCGAQPDATSSDTISPISSDDRGAAVIITGTLSPDGTVCPSEQTECDYAIAIDGEVGDALAGDFVSGEGWYDGQRLQLAAPLARVESPFVQASHASLCPEMSNPVSVNANSALDVARSIVGADESDTVLSAAWIDRDTNVVTLWFARDLDRYRDDLLSAYGDMQVCLVERAALSLDELFDVSARVDETLRQRGIAVQGGSMIDELRHWVVVPVEAIDAAGRAALEELEAVVVVPFIELLDRPLSELPAWQLAVVGTVDLITTASRTSGGMDALGTFDIQYDVSGNCLYAEMDGRRTSFVWPFGYSATESNGEVTVFDARGAPSATTRATIQMGGGGGDDIVLATIGDNRCGADTFWFVNDL